MSLTRSSEARLSPEREDLWRRIALHDFEVADQAPNFLERLARDRGWSLAFARGAIEEYRRFAFLCVIAAEPMTPSQEVDEVWHLHLTYSRDYWDRWCARVLQAPLHHDPSRGGPEQLRYFQARYGATLAVYETWFGPPPVAYWPGTRDRFRGRPRFAGVDLDQVAIMPRFWSPRFWRGFFIGSRRR